MYSIAGGDSITRSGDGVCACNLNNTVFHSTYWGIGNTLVEYIIHYMEEHQVMVDLLDYLNSICIKIQMNRCGLMTQF